MKEFLAWSDELSVGVNEIDNQHKTLIEMINKLSEGIGGGWGKDARKEVIDELIDYTRVHFATEESLMSISKYPNHSDHNRKHEKLIDLVNEYVKKYEQDPESSSYDLLYFLKRWLTEHIMHEDKTLGEYLVKQGANVANKKKSWFRSLFGVARGA